MIKVYTKTVCPKCMVAKAQLEDQGIEYEALNIDTDSKAKEVLVDKGFMGVPVFEKDNKFFGSLNELLSSDDVG